MIAVSSPPVVAIGTHVWVREDRADFECTGAIVASVRRAADGTIAAVRVHVGHELSDWLPPTKVKAIDYTDDVKISHVRLLIDGKLTNWIPVDQVRAAA